MFIITVKESHEIMAMGAELDHMSNGYPRLVNENIAFPPEMVDIYEVASVPAEVEPAKYCYTPADGFTPNPDYREPNPYGVPEEIYNAIIDDYTMELIDGGVIE